METTELQYPVFEANQVLTSAHLNDMFEYLDEQTRLTRADLIGIGIVCGLEVSLVGADAVRLTRGCGVTSQGYLIVEPADVTMHLARSYVLPGDVGYQPFMKPGQVPPEQYPLWELITDENDLAAVKLSTLDLSRLAVVLLLELRRERGRTCAPSDCDDRGAAVTTTVRRLLIDVDHIAAVIAAGRADAVVPLAVDVEKRLALRELRMPRFDVPNTAPVTAEKVLQGFQAVFRREGLAEAAATALSSLYGAFAPLVKEDFATDPFAGFRGRFGFLDREPATVGQVRGIQHFYDLFADVIAAYDEVRRAGVELVCACCPPQGLFPRHLVAGVLAPKPGDTFEYRTRFVPSPAVSRCADRARDVRVLFRRLVTMIERFSEAPAAKGIRVTPSRTAAPLSQKAIPYYYGQQGAPALYRLWDPAKSAQGHPEFNLSYRSDEYAPPAPSFVTDPLRFDLEPSDFLRIEGHIGTDVRTALASLLAQQKRSRLPIDVIALRAGTFDEGIEIDLAKERCRFQDIEPLYDTLKAELECFLVTQTEYFYGLPLSAAPVAELDLTPTLPLLRARATDLLAKPGTLGHGIESILTWKAGKERPFEFAVGGVPHFPSQATALTVAMSSLSEVLTDDLRDLDFDAFDARYAAIVEIARQMEDARRQGLYNEPGLSERLDDIVFRCRRSPFDALAEQYRRRVREVKQEQFLGNFLERHPGIQHKGGVPVGGTFILVYHERPAPRRVRRPQDAGGLIGLAQTIAGRAPVLDLGVAELDLAGVRERLTDRVEFLEDADVQTVLSILPLLLSKYTFALPDPARVYADTVAGLADGTVIADFFLPYVCRSNCPPIQYQLPPTRLHPTMSKTCTNADGFSEVTVLVEGVSGGLSVQVDGEAFAELANPLVLDVGDHRIVVRDSAGGESSPVTVTIPPPLVIHQVEKAVDTAKGSYRVMFAVAGGTPPYLADPEGLVDAVYTSPVVAIADRLTVTVTDAVGCTVTEAFDSGVKPCTYPCDGEALREGFRFWMPEPVSGAPFHEFVLEVGRIVVTDPGGTDHDVSDAVREGLAGAPASLKAASFENTVNGWLTIIENAIAEAFEQVGAAKAEHWLRLAYRSAADGAHTGTLYVDRLACVHFEFDMRVSFLLRETPQQLESDYQPSSARHIDGVAGTEFELPAFDRANANWCRGEDWVRECEGAQLELRIRRDDQLRFTAEVGAGDQPVAFFWEIQDGRPTAAGGAELELREFEPIEPTIKQVRLTVITERGCTVSVETEAELG